MHIQLLVRVLEVLADGAGREPERPRDLCVRPAIRVRLRARSPCSAAAKLSQVRKQEIEHRAITLGEIVVRTIELEPGHVGTAGIQPKSHHVLDTQEARDVLIEL